MKVGMLIRRPPAEVFQALVDPAITTKFWFTRSTGKLTPGADIRWDWEMYGLSVAVFVKEVEEHSRIVFEWGDDKPSTVELHFTPRENDTTYVQVTDTRHAANDGDEIASHVADSASGFAIVLCALKALLEHDLALNAVMDAHAAGFEH
jgi:uncharacterized protein YndB with AHSA1/START domain